VRTVEPVDMSMIATEFAASTAMANHRASPDAAQLFGVPRTG
jgi:hypothetical protein